MVWLFWECPLFKFDCWFHLGYVCCCFQVGRTTTDMMCCHCLTSEARISVGPLLLMLTAHLVRVVYFQSMNMLCLSSPTFTVCLVSSQGWIVSDLWHDGYNMVLFLSVFLHVLVGIVQQKRLVLFIILLESMWTWGFVIKWKVLKSSVDCSFLTYNTPNVI